MLLKNVLLYTVLIGWIPSVWSFEPFTSVLGVGAVGAAFYGVGYMLKCRFYECCNDNRWVINNITALHGELHRRLYGQHLVKKAVANHIQGHVRKHHPVKALALSFHGPTGTGKNHVSHIIANALYKKGLQSENVRFIAATKNFPHQHKVSKYKDQLKDVVEKQVKKCPQSLFIFDEIDKMPAGLIDTLKPYLDYVDHLDGVDYRHAIFIFLSNAGSESITEYVLQQLREGVKREEIGLVGAEKILAKAAVNSKSKEGYWHSELISKHLITAFLPFLPLERKHIRQCVQDLMVLRKYYKSQRSVPDEKVEDVLAELTFYPEKEQMFSVTGCKRVAEKVDYVMFGSR